MNHDNGNQGWTQVVNGVVLQSPNPLHHDPKHILAVSPFGWFAGTQEFHKIYSNTTCSCSQWKARGGCVHIQAYEAIKKELENAH